MHISHCTPIVFTLPRLTEAADATYLGVLIFVQHSTVESKNRSSYLVSLPWQCFNMEDVPHGNVTYSELIFLLLTSCVDSKKSFVTKRLECYQSVLVHLLAGISSFKEGIDRLCECCGHRKCVLSTHCERTGSSGAA